MSNLFKLLVLLHLGILFLGIPAHAQKKQIIPDKDAIVVTFNDGRDSMMMVDIPNKTLYHPDFPEFIVRDFMRRASMPILNEHIASNFLLLLQIGKDTSYYAPYYPPTSMGDVQINYITTFPKRIGKDVLLFTLPITNEIINLQDVKRAELYLYIFPIPQKSIDELDSLYAQFKQKFFDILELRYSYKRDFFDNLIPVDNPSKYLWKDYQNKSVGLYTGKPGRDKDFVWKKFKENGFQIQQTTPQIIITHELFDGDVTIDYSKNIEITIRFNEKL